MKRQRDMSQMKGQNKTPEKELNEMEISNLSDAEFKTLVIKMFKELSEDLNSIKKIQSEMKDMLIEVKNRLQGNNSRVHEAKSQTNDMEQRKKKTEDKSTEKKKCIQHKLDSVTLLLKILRNILTA